MRDSFCWLKTVELPKVEFLHRLGRELKNEGLASYIYCELYSLTSLYSLTILMQSRDLSDTYSNISEQT